MQKAAIYLTEFFAVSFPVHPPGFFARLQTLKNQKTIIQKWPAEIASLSQEKQMMHVCHMTATWKRCCTSALSPSPASTGGPPAERSPAVISCWSEKQWGGKRSEGQVTCSQSQKRPERLMSLAEVRQRSAVWRPGRKNKKKKGFEMHSLITVSKSRYCGANECVVDSIWRRKSFYRDTKTITSCSVTTAMLWATLTLPRMGWSLVKSFVYGNLHVVPGVICGVSAVSSTCTLRNSSTENWGRFFPLALAARGAQRYYCATLSITRQWIHTQLRSKQRHLKPSSKSRIELNDVCKSSNQFWHFQMATQGLQCSR